MMWRERIPLWSALAVILSPIWLCTSIGRTINVDDNGTGDYPTIQAAIDDANDGDTVILQAGTYTGDGNRDIDFKGKAITVRSTDPNDSNIVIATIIDCSGTADEPHRGFYFHSGEDTNSVLKGLTLVHGFADKGGGILCDNSSPTIMRCTISDCQTYADGSGGFGGGICCEYSSAFISKCIICENTAHTWEAISPFGGLGGGILCFRGEPIISACIVKSNHGVGPGARGSGGIHCISSDATIVHCIIRNNHNSGIYINKGEPKIEDCVIENNQFNGVTCYYGGRTTVEQCTIRCNPVQGINCERSSVEVSHCLIEGNSFTQGAGIYCRFGELKLCNCTIVDNCWWLKYSCAGVRCLEESNCEVRNCIVFRNGSLDREIEIAVHGSDASCAILSSAVRRGYAGISAGSGGSIIWKDNNIEDEPCFIAPGHWDPNGTPDNTEDDFWVDGDYHLKSQAGRWDPNAQSWVKDNVTSPCINAGDQASPIGNEPFPNGGRINMGAYGGTAEASKSYFGEPLCETIVAGDINGDCKVDFADFEIIALHWLNDYTPSK
jgi:hypothetical protein